jgi:hypothetical protein
MNKIDDRSLIGIGLGGGRPGVLSGGMASAQTRRSSLQDTQTINKKSVT